MNRSFMEVIEEIRTRDPRYTIDAYEFVMEALSFTQKRFNRPKHVTGIELLEGVKELLLNRFGPMTLLVLRHWGIHATEDFGHIVFNLVDNRILSKTDDDKIDNFKDGYNFEEVFEKGYQRQLAKKISRMR